MSSSRWVPTSATRWPRAAAGTVIAEPMTPAPRMTISATKRSSRVEIEKVDSIGRGRERQRLSRRQLNPIARDRADVVLADPRVNMRFRSGRLDHVDGGRPSRARGRPQVFGADSESDALTD